MQDSILHGYLSDFKEQHQLNLESESDLFELFCIYCIGSRNYSDLEEFEELRVAGSQDLGIDGIIFTVNGHVILNEEALDHFLDKNIQLEVSFTFIQAKTSRPFKAGEIGTFMFGVYDFFSQNNSQPENEHIQAYRRMKDKIYEKSINFYENPKLSLYYITTGEWRNDPTVKGRIKREKERLDRTRLFSEVNFIPVDGEKLKLFYQELRRKVIREINFTRYTVFPEIEGIRQAYSGILSCSEFLKLIKDSDGELQRSLFYENVRDFQGDNPVNQEIEKTLNDPSQKDKLCVLNNGVTIVAKSINQVGNTFRLQDFQIVNGCQTSHVLFRNHKIIDENTHLPVKLIEAHDIEIINQITKATNRQTEVKIEAFESLRQFHKNIEEFYAHADFGIEPRLYYERRNRQYIDSELMRHQIITMPFQLQCYIAVCLEEPHSTHRYYGELLNAYKPRVFQDSHSFWPYYISVLILKRIDTMLYEGKLHGWVKKFRYQLAFMFRYQFGKTPSPSNHKECEQYYRKILTFLKNRGKADQNIINLAKILLKVRKDMSAKETKRAKLNAMKQFTEELKNSTTKLS